MANQLGFGVFLGYCGFLLCCLWFDSWVCFRKERRKEREAWWRSSVLAMLDLKSLVFYFSLVKDKKKYRGWWGGGRIGSCRWVLTMMGDEEDERT